MMGEAMNDFPECPDVPIDEILDRLRTDFLDEAGDVIESLDQLLDKVRHGDDAPQTALSSARRAAHNLKGMGGSFGYPLVTVIAHRMEDYLSNLSTLSEEHVSDVQVFVDRIQDAIDGKGDAPEDQDPAYVVRTLPVHRANHRANHGAFHGAVGQAEIDPETIVKHNVEILLAMPPGASTRIVTRELQACGYRVSTVSSSFEAIELIVRTRPDLVITSAVVDELSGVDLSAALAAMPATRRIPVGLASSFSKDHPELEGLPETVALLRKGESFADDLALALTRFEVF